MMFFKSRSHFVLLLLFISCFICWNNASVHEGQLLMIILPPNNLADFSYTPTGEGYRYSYELFDGTRHEERAVIPGAAEYAAHTTPRSLEGRPREGVKIRKLSAKTLQSLAG